MPITKSLMRAIHRYRVLNSTGVPVAFHSDWSAYREVHSMKPNYSAVAYGYNL